MIVVDASLLVHALTDDGRVGDLSREALVGDVHWAGPAHLLVETFAGIRGRLQRHAIGDRRAEDAVGALRAAEIELLPTGELLPRMWELRHQVSGYDAAYVAAAEATGTPLLTADRRLARAHGVRCTIRLVSSA